MTKRKYLRRRLLALAPALVIAVVAIGLLTGGGGKPPPDDAAAYVPQSAALYLHLNTDRSGSGWDRASALARKLPIFAQVRDRLLTSARVPAGDLRLDNGAAWLGNEAAYAQLPGAKAGQALPLLVLKTKDESAARAALARFRTVGTYRGLTLYDVGGSRAALDQGYVVFGSERALRAAVDARAGSQRSLAASSTYSKLRGKLPNDRLAHAWLTAPAIQRYAAGPMRLLAGAAGLGQLRDAVVAFSPRGDDFSLSVRGDASGAGVCPAGGGADALANRAPERPALFAGTARLDCVVRQALTAGGGTGFGRTLARFVGLAKSSSGLDLARDLLPLLSKPASLVIDPGASQPAVTLSVHDVGKGKGIGLVGRLQPALVKLVSPEQAGDTPGFSSGTVAGQRTLSTRLTSSLGLEYAEVDGDLVVSNGPQGIAAAAKGKHLKDNGDYGKLLSHRPKGAASVLFLDFDKLLALADQAGLARNPAYAAVRDDLQKIGAAGAYVAREGEQLNAEASFRNP